MSVVFVGSRIHDFGTAASRELNTAFFDSDYQNEGIRVPMEEATAMTVLLPTAVSDDLWVHYRIYHNRNFASGMANADGIQISFFDIDRNELAYIDMADGVTRAFANGDTVVAGTGTFTWPSVGNPTITFDIRVSVGANIVIDYYVGGMLLSTATAANSGGKGKPIFISIDNNDLQGSSGGDNGVSEVIMTDGESTIGWRLATLDPDGAGTYTAWTGDYLDIQDGTDGRFLIAASTGLRESWNLSPYNAPPTPSGIRGVFVKFQGDKGDTGPQAYQAFLRINGDDYDATPQTPVPGLFNLFEWADNPATAAPWDTSAFATLEVGIRSQT